MTTLSYSQTRQNLKSIFDAVSSDSEPVFVKRRNGKGVVIISEEDYASLNETAYLLATPANRKHLKAGLKNIEENKIETFESLEALDHAL